MTVTPTQVATDAADLLEREGWVQGAYRCADGYCLDGALYQATGALREIHRYETQSVTTAAVRVRDALRALPGVDGNIIFWNDIPGRTKDEVVGVLRTVAEQLDT